MTLPFDTFELLTFDCYGTLIDWERGILDALRPLLAKHDRALDDDALLELYGACESAIQSETYMPYRAVLRAVVYEIAARLGFGLDPGDDQTLAESLGNWPAFPDTRTALAALRRRYRLGVLSNIDRDLFALSVPHLGIEPDLLVSAQDIKSYKPARAHFDEALRLTGLPVERVLHVAQSRFHDIAPARALGFTTVWVDRRQGKAGGGATAPSDAQPHLTVPDLATLVAMIEASDAPR
ncbi:MAG: haloacid dehalogenase type II [Candidatus Sumerlaeia bacterium]|nr:haloacid dehalogenase type II [Candidatus Sumerlaeia bacterium]